ncbi:MAG: DPP IV N-terminal domain-containing protein, partial [Blastocatellia bacterium]
MTCFRKLTLLALVLLLAQPIAIRAIASTQGGKPVDSVPSFAEPALSPDRSEIAFVSGGDIWTVPAAGGEARLLVSHPANDTRPLYSPDGRKLAFISNRTGNGDIYIINFDTGDLKRLTFDDGNDQLDAWSRDGRWIYFSSTTRDISGMNDLFRVNVEGGTPMQVSADRYASEYFSAPSPDGKALAFTARGTASGQWWRKGHSHLDECEIWLLKDTPTPSYDQLTEGGAKNMWPMWSADGANIFFVSDRSGAQNIWTVSAKGSGPNSEPGSTQRLGDRGRGAEPRQITRFKDGRVLWPNISYDGKAIVFERNFAIWKMDTATGQASEVPIVRRGTPIGPSVEHLRLTDQIQELNLSPDGKKVAFVVRGEIFAASAKDGGDAARVTNTPSLESQIAWAPDSRKLAYVSDRDGAPHVYLYDFASNGETQLTREVMGDASPTFSPDGKSLAFQRDARELRVIDLDSKQERLLATGVFERPPISSPRSFVWSPDNKWIAFTSTSGKSFTNVSVVAAAGGEAKQISFLSNVFNNTISWSHDGAFILFDTAQRTEGSQIARVDLIPRTPRFREDQFRDLFKEESPRPARTSQPAQETRPNPNDSQNAAPAVPNANEKKQPPKPVEIVFDGIKKRLSLLPAGVDAGSQEISPDGRWLLMIAGAAGQQNLYVYSLDELAREPAVARQLTSTSGFKRDAQFSPDGKEVFYLEQGRINVVAVDTRVARPLAVNAEMDVDFAREKIEVFNQAWSYLRDSFYDPSFHGIDWQAVRADYAPRIAGARTPDEMRRLLSL